MDPSPKASSLYGPGAFVGWLCTAVSVFISWTFNRHSKARDTIGNDLIATLTIPSIAAIHHQYELHKMNKNGTEPATETLIPTLCIVVWFTAIGPGLFGLAAFTGRPKRCICNGIVFILCVSVLLAVPSWQDQFVKLPLARGWKIILLIGLAIAGVIGEHFQLRNLLKSQSSDRRACSKEDRPEHPGSGTGALKLLFLAIWLLVAVSGMMLEFRIPVPDKAPDLTLSECFVPQTEYSITELDQAVAMSAGLVTIIFAAYEAYSSRTRSAWERYQEWRTRCEDLLEEGVTEDNEASQWKEWLREMAQHEKEMLDAPTGTEVLAALEQRKKDREAERLSPEEKKYLAGQMSEDEAIAYRLRQAGFL